MKAIITALLNRGYIQVSATTYEHATGHAFDIISGSITDVDPDGFTLSHCSAVQSQSARFNFVTARIAGNIARNS